MILDVSYHQGTIDWDRVAAADHVAWKGPHGVETGNGKIEGAIIKATGEEIGRTFTDSQFKRNWLNAKVAGVRRGAYHFLNGAAGTKGGRDEALYFLDAVYQAGGMKEGDFLPTVDVEWPVKAAAFEIDQLGAYIETMRDEGYTPIVYAGRWHWEAIPDVRAVFEVVSGCPLWLAAYVREYPAPPKPWPRVDMWQFTDKGRIDGIEGAVDLNRLYVNIETVSL
ncbi:MAG: glycoside hydrolase family 25 protein [Rhodocyclaceae bacterium]|nr:glycoside hydrolase family 25 protein [Rhodocyclaceae bacterium]